MHQKVAEELLEFMEYSGKSRQQIAKETGLSSSVISQFLNMKYTGDNEEIARILKNYLKIAKERVSINNRTRFYERLTNTEKVRFACTYAHARNDITLVYGDAGAGKTTALEYYRDTHAGVVMVTANSCTASASAVLKLISQKIGKTITGKKDDMMNEIVHYFKGTNRLLIIDEADHLTLAALQAVRNLNDEAKIGIVLAGNSKIYNQMLIGSKSSELQQLKTRIVVRRKVENLYTLEEFRHIFPDIADECLGFLMEIAQEESLRTAVKILNLLYDVSDKITLKDLNKKRLELTEGL